MTLTNHETLLFSGVHSLGSSRSCVIIDALPQGKRYAGQCLYLGSPCGNVGEIGPGYYLPPPLPLKILSGMKQ